MSTCGSPTNTFRGRYKPLENFLKRLAFNLGNSPSQTDVKIISCIPIDVSDLQQKIISLEKQIQDGKKSSKPKVCCANAFVYPASVYTRNPMKECSTSCNFGVNLEPLNKNEELIANQSNVEYQLQNIISPPPCKKELQQERNSQTNININKKKKIKRDYKTNHLVYRATTNPTKFEIPMPFKKRNSSKPYLDQSYVAHMFQKQYENSVFKNMDNSSQISTPVCRDIKANERLVAVEPDLCSCCHGHFTNIDEQTKDSGKYFDSKQVYMMHDYENLNKLYYDSSFYDLIPVRDKPKPKKPYNENSRKIDELYHNMEILCCPDPIRMKTKTPPLTSVRQKQPSLEKQINRPKNQQVSYNTQFSSPSYVDCGSVYKKNISPECFYLSPSHIQNNVGNMKSLKTNNDKQRKDDNKANENYLKPELGIPCDTSNTEECLNEIKGILQNVLKEIKTNTKSRNDGVKYAPDLKQKSTIGQNTCRGDNVEVESTLLHSYSYDPYNMNSYNLKSCSYNLSSSPMYPLLPFQPVRCVHPLMVQTPNPYCHGCLKQPSRSYGSTHNRNKLNTIATNTDTAARADSNETEKLIKEIYKSVFLNLSEGSEPKDDCSQQSAKVKADQRENVENLRKSFNDGDYNCQLNKNYNPKTNSSTPNLSDTSTITDVKEKNNFAVECNLAKISQKALDKITEKAEPESAAELSLTEEMYDSKSESSVDAVAIKHEQKKNPKSSNIFFKLIKSVKRFKRKTPVSKTKNKLGTSESDATSDSDEYTTVYSDKSQRTKVNTRSAFPRQPTISFEKKPKLNYNMQPYMEQEYRRYWAENLTFEKNQRLKNTSELPISCDPVKSPLYWQNFETRPLMVHHDNAPTYKTKSRIYCDRSNSSGFSKDKFQTPRARNKNTALTWLRKYKTGVQQCGQSWKKVILES